MRKDSITIGMIKAPALGVFVALLTAGSQGCEVSVPSTIDNIDTTRSGAACSPCEFLGSDAMCLDRDLPPIAAALSDPNQGPALEAGASACGLENEVCIPCVNPLTGESTGACELGPAVCGADGEESTCESPKAIIDPEFFPACAVGGRCISKSIVESTTGGTADRLPSCDQTEDGVCVPEDAVRFAGGYKPVSCSIGGNDGLEGRCLPEFIIPAESLDRIASLPQDNLCGEAELCAPCFDPLTGEDTGACSSTSCDAPQNPSAGFSTCFDGRGQCVPEAIILSRNPDQSTENLNSRDCLGENLCVPNRLLAEPAEYQSCSSLLLGQGTCLDTEVLDIPLSGLFRQNSCPAVEKCVPCETQGNPTGAPGCAELYGQ